MLRPSEGTNLLDVPHILDFLNRRWRLIAMVAAAIISLTFIVLLVLTPRYTAQTEILLDLRQQTVSSPDQLMPGAVFDPLVVDSQIAIIKSVSLLRRVVEKENLVNDPEFGVDPNAGPPWYSFITNFIRSLTSSGTPEPVAEAGEDAIPRDVRITIARLQQALTVTREGATYVLLVEFSSEDPVKAARLSNAISNAFILDQLEARFDAARRSASWFDQRLQTLRDELRKSEEAVESFRAQNNLVGPSNGTGITTTLNETQMSEISGNLVAARADAAEKQAKFAQAQRIIREGGNVQAVPDVLRSQVISNLRGQQAEVNRREADLVARYGERHPLVVNVRAERRELERQINAEVTRVIGVLKNDYDVAQSRVDSLASSVATASGQAGTDNALSVRLRELERVALANKTLYESFLGQSKIATEQTSFQVREARIISAATTPSIPTFPKTLLIMILAGVAGVMVGAGLAVLLEALNAGFNSPRQVEETLGLPVLTSIERADLSDFTARDGGPVLAAYLLAKPLSRYSESIRSLRAGIQMSDVDNPPKVIQVTSSAPNEGKTSIALSLAVSSASSGKKTVLVDCDLRRPTASSLFGLQGQPGLVELLTQTASHEGILHRDKATGVFVLPAGGRTQNPPDLLSSQRMQQLIDHLRQNFDLVVIDTPPIGPVIDAALLASIADKVLFTVRWSATSRELVQHAVDQIPGDRKICGVALNMIDVRRAPKYGRYSYYSSNYYNKYYVE
ncbi:MAG TPA: polysaccharide biosynthesis tyrosine autokinase [Xanthobacteraceae bacterium]|nr:polysaccharide biosynthesis tyrosine autokinase [Xanthobacteraceae bacterium]